MAGHSHSANVKWRKDRQVQARSQKHQRVRREIEKLIEQEGKLSEKALVLAREKNFPKEKVYQIWEKSKQKPAKKKESFLSQLYQAPFGIVIYCQGSEENFAREFPLLSQELEWKEINKTNLFTYFRQVNLWEIASPETEIEQKILSLFSSLTLNQIEKFELKDQQLEIVFATKESGKLIEKELTGTNFLVKSKKEIWQPLILQELSSPKAQEYAKKLRQELKKSKLAFTTNC